jgi:hypothetical protein
VTFAGKVYKTFSPESDAVFGGDIDLSVYPEFWGGIDFGFRNPTAVGVFGMDRDDRMDMVDGLYSSDMTTPQLIDHLRQMQQEYSVQRWFADPAAPGDIQELRSAGLPVYPAPRVKGELDRSYIKAGIVKVESRLISGRLRIHESREDAIREMDGYRYPGKKEGAESKETPLKVDDHNPDMIRYVVVGVHAHGRAPRARVAA